MGESLATLLRVASDPVGGARPPAVAELVARRRRRSGLRTGAAVVATVAATVALAVAVNWPDGRPTTATTPVATPTVTPVAAVTVDQLAKYHWRSLPRAPISPRDGA